MDLFLLFSEAFWLLLLMVGPAGLAGLARVSNILRYPQVYVAVQENLLLHHALEEVISSKYL